MNEKEFRQYVYEERRQGRSDSQIARSLGMNLAHFMGRLNGVDVDKVDPPKKTNAATAKDLGIKEAPVRTMSMLAVKPISGAMQPEKHEKPKKEKVAEATREAPTEDLSWME